jgi:hypothetical protein
MTTTIDRTETNSPESRNRTGPKSGRVKDHSRAKLLESGRASRTLVLPGEELDSFRRRMAAWTATLHPRNSLERYLVERAVKLSWQLDRADRAEAARLVGMVREVVAEESVVTEKLSAISFDRSIEGEQSRRYQIACGRALSRTLDTLLKVRRLLAVNRPAK